MISEIINIDLHIHSVCSLYKENDKSVLNSTIENLDVLINKLEEYNISLCAITDHNRFDYDLYLALKQKIQTSTKKIVKNNLPGVEFDVFLEPNSDKSRCHIIVIFDDSDNEKLKNLQSNMFKIKKLESEDETYTIDEFEKVLKEIGLSTILIVHQKQSLNNDSGNHASLSGATSSPYVFIKVGYIDCLEYNRPKVEGIIKSNLRDVKLEFPLITGSDCHDWSAYPYKSHKSEKGEICFTNFKCLPTFKGLLLAITSFKTRANRVPNTNNHYIKSICINNKEYPLSNGINAIIGDNGSGKSLIANVLADSIKSYYKELIKDNNISVKYNDESFQKAEINYIDQGSINEKVISGKLFDKSDKAYFNEIPAIYEFKNNIINYFNELFIYINSNIAKKETLDNLAKKNFTIKVINKSFFHPVISANIEINDITEFSNRVTAINNIIKLLKKELNNYQKYYDELNITEQLKTILNSILGIEKIVDSVYKAEKTNNIVKGIIQNQFNNFNISLESKRSSDEIKKKNYLNDCDGFKDSIISAIKSENQKNIYPLFPEPMEGISTKDYKGYRFTKIADFHKLDLKDQFYEYCFNKGYKSEDKIMLINTKDDFSSALSNYNYDQINEFKEQKLNKFINDYSNEKTMISEISSSTSIGNTPGEIALIFYKFTIQEADKDYCVLVIDQPEDDINPKRLTDYLNAYLNSIRDKKQIIIVTHNPLLVVNLDVDNVICLNKTSNVIEAKTGALEYENNDYSILDLVKNNLDRGYDAIERRLKAYGKDRD